MDREPQDAPAPLLLHRSSVTLDMLQAATDGFASCDCALLALHSQASYDRSITIETAKGREVAVSVWSDMPVTLIKEEIRRLIDVPVGLQRLSFQEQELKDGLDVSHYGIVPGSRLFLSTPFVVDAPTLGYPIALDRVDAHDTIARVKELLELASEGELPAATTALRLDGVDMEDGKAILDYHQLASGILVTAVPASSAAEDGDWDWLEFAHVDEQHTVEVAAVHQPPAAGLQRVTTTVRTTSDAELSCDVAKVLHAVRANQPRVTTTVREASDAELNSDVAKFLHAARANLIGNDVATHQPRATTVREASDAELNSDVAKFLRAAHANLIGSEVAEFLRSAAAAMHHWGIRVTVVMPWGQPVVLEVGGADTVHDLRRMISAHFQPPEQYYLAQGHHQMEDDRSLISYDVRDGDTVFIIPAP